MVDADNVATPAGRQNPMKRSKRFIASASAPSMSASQTTVTANDSEQSESLVYDTPVKKLAAVDLSGGEQSSVGVSTRTTKRARQN